MMNDTARQLRELGLPLNTIYNVVDAHKLSDYYEDVEACYYDSERYYDEDGYSIRKGSRYIPSRFAAQ